MANPVARYADELLKIFGPGRVFFDEEIRTLASHDLSNPPPIPVDFLINRMPDAVVVPRTEGEIVRLLQLATLGRIPVTPRASASSAYGGSVPAKGGVVVELTQLNQEITVDVAQETVTVDPGVLIWDLERELNRHGLALMTYPTSAPIATIGGHVCQGGVGMGSFQYGPVANQVLSARIVLPDGDVKTYSGRELEVVAECEGITGIVTKLTLRVTKKLEKVPVVATFDSAAALAKALPDLANRFRPWNITFHNPTFSMLREEAGGPKTIPRKKFSAIFVFSRDEWQKSQTAFTEAITKAAGKLLPEATAQQEWGEIFNTLRAKALGPSIAPGEVVFPLSRLDKFLETVEKRFDYAPVSMEGTIIQGGHVTILAFALEDERRMWYPTGFSVGLQLLKIGKELGGRAYAPGVYLAGEARDVFGNRRYQRIVDFKRAVDKARIMNPGKIISIRPRGKAILLGIPPLPAPPGAPLSTVDKILNAPPAVWGLSKVAPLLRYSRQDEAPATQLAIHKAWAETQAGGFGSRHDWTVFATNHSGFHRQETPLSKAVGMEAATHNGLLWWAKLYLKGKLPVTRKVTDLVAAAAEFTDPNDKALNGTPLVQVYKDLKAQLEFDSGRTLATPEALRPRVAAAQAALAEKEKRFATPVAPPPAPVAPAKPAAPHPKPPAAAPAAKPEAAAAPKPAA